MAPWDADESALDLDSDDIFFGDEEDFDTDDEKPEDFDDNEFFDNMED